MYAQELYTMSQHIHKLLAFDLIYLFDLFYFILLSVQVAQSSGDWLQLIRLQQP